MVLEIIDKDTAKKLGNVWYFTDTPCQNGHVDKRYVSTGICYACKRERNKSCNNRNPDRLKKSSQSQYLKHKEKKLLANENWAFKNQEKTKEIKRRNKIKYREKYLTTEKNRIKIKRIEDPFWRLNKNISKSMWHTLKLNKNGKTWTKHVDYSLDELVIHLESQFRDGMTWKNYGPFWHVDHIKPKCRCESHAETWALKNLQPLLKFENLSKGSKY